MRRIVDAPTRRPTFSSSPWMRLFIAPGRVLSRELLDQCCEFRIDGWASGAVRVGPLLRDEAAMPAQDGGRCDQPMRE